MYKLGVEWSPLDTLIQHHFEAIAVGFYCSLIVVWPCFFICLCICLLLTPYYYISLTYLTWMFYDVVLRDTSSKGGRRWNTWRRSVIWTYFRDYFPISLTKTADLDPAKNYIFGCHPHGVMCCGAVCNFGSEATGFREKYPGITPHLCTLKLTFKVPFVRILLLWMGVCDVSAESINYIMSHQGRGQAAILVIGGVKEALESRPDTYKLTLRHRKGFVKMALKTGANLVPVFSFGENELLHQADSPSIRALQYKMKQYFRLAPPLFYGRGVFNEPFGLIPFRKPVHTVVGGAIEVPQIDDPDEQTVDKYHALYMNKLNELFDEYKIQHGLTPDTKLEFI